SGDRAVCQRSQSPWQLRDRCGSPPGSLRSRHRGLRQPREERHLLLPCRDGEDRSLLDERVRPRWSDQSFDWEFPLSAPSIGTSEGQSMPDDLWACWAQGAAVWLLVRSWISLGESVHCRLAKRSTPTL